MAFTCPRCGATSRNPFDERERYCERCREFFVEVPARFLASMRPADLACDLVLALRGHPLEGEAAVLYAKLLAAVGDAVAEGRRLDPARSAEGQAPVSPGSRTTR